jgi:serine protease AprX
MRKTIFAILISFVLIFGAGAASRADVIDPELDTMLLTLDPDDQVSVIVTLTDQADLNKIKDKDKGKRRSAVIAELKDTAKITQKDIKEFLKQYKLKRLMSFWIFNGFALTAAKDVILELADQPGIESIRLDNTLSRSVKAPAAAGVPEWNLDAVRAPELWDLGITGSGIVVATMDTGVDAAHADLSGRWRGGSNSWYDPNGEHAMPYDTDGHGTQVMGVLVGGDATGSAIGVAPGARWIAVKIFNDAGVAEYSDIHQGFQWLLDPDDNPATNDSPDVVNNSWGFRELVNQCFTEFEPDIQALKAAEIAVVFSAGNLGPYAYTSESPANYPESFAVGAVDDSLAIADFSGRGPSACGDIFYPEVAAPGVNIKTADKTFGGLFPDASISATGTSIAAPHVSGAMALLLSVYPDAEVSELESALEDSAMDLGSAGPDNDSGFGLIDVVEAHNMLDQGTGGCTDADGDGYDSDTGCGSDCDDNDPNVYPGAPESKHDGIDQDCNGYDLTLDITRADYNAKKDTLSVEATSDLGKNAALILDGYGPMKWDRKKLKYKISVRRAGGDPVTVMVSGIEGAEIAPTT